MVKLKSTQYTSTKTGELKQSFRVGMMNPIGYGLTINDSIFGQFAMEPFIKTVNWMKNGQPSTFESVKATVKWLNYDYSDPNMMPDNYGCFSLELPAGLAPLLRAQSWKGRFFIIYIEQFKGKAGDDRTRFKLLETDAQGQPLPQQPQPVYNNPVPDNRQATPQYYPGHAPVQQQNYVPQPQRPIQNQGFNAGPAGMPVQGRIPQNQTQAYQVPQQNVFPRQAVPQVSQVSAPRIAAMQQNPQNPPQVQYNGMNVQNTRPTPVQNSMPSLPPLQNMNYNNNQVPNMQQAMPQAPIVQQGNSVPVQPQSSQAMATQSPHDLYSKHGLLNDEIEVLESLLHDPQLTVWKESANKSQQSFNDAITIVPNVLRQKGINVQLQENRLPLLWNVWNTL